MNRFQLWNIKRHRKISENRQKISEKGQLHFVLGYLAMIIPTMSISLIAISYFLDVELFNRKAILGYITALVINIIAPMLIWRINEYELKAKL